MSRQCDKIPSPWLYKFAAIAQLQQAASSAGIGTFGLTETGSDSNSNSSSYEYDRWDLSSDSREGTDSSH